MSIEREFLGLPLPRGIEPLPLDPAIARAAGEGRELRSVAAAFEALFLRTLLRQMLDSQLDEGVFGSGAGSTIYEGMFLDHLSEQLADDSPLGIARLLESQWAREELPDDSADQAAALEHVRRIAATRIYEESISRAPGVPIESPRLSRPSDPARVLQDAPMCLPTSHPRQPLVSAPVPAPRSRPQAAAGPAPGDHISSAWGWRKDPIDGRRRFHGGVDLPAPTGTPVRSAAAGRVAQVAREGGYGLHVVLDHGQGWTSRYAHLSEASVTVGETVDRGDPLGRVGSSGRATGPHLHLETSRDGVRQDPTVILGRQLRPQVLGLSTDNRNGD